MLGSRHGEMELSWSARRAMPPAAAGIYTDRHRGQVGLASGCSCAKPLAKRDHYVVPSGKQYRSCFGTTPQEVFADAE